MHDLRVAYGWGDDEIVDHYEQFGLSWLMNSWKYAKEDKVEAYRMQMNFMPLARTPDSSKSARSLKSLAEKLEKLLDSLVPWQKKSAGRHLRESLRGKVKPGEVLVILEGGESKDNPLFKNAKTIRE